jgi:hypothetical protein
VSRSAFFGVSLQRLRAIVQALRGVGTRQGVKLLLAIKQQIGAFLRADGLGNRAIRPRSASHPPHVALVATPITVS